MNNYRLSEITKIITGYTFRSAIENSDNGNYKVIQAKDISDDFEISDLNLTKVNLDKPITNALVKTDDVILTSRGRYQASIMKSSEKTIASSSVFVIRVSNQNVDPHYLAIFLNSRHGQIQLEKLNSGSYIKSIPKSNLEDLIIQIPSLSIQKKIVSLYQNIMNQQRLLQRQIELISNISESSLIKILK